MADEGGPRRLPCPRCGAAHAADTESCREKLLRLGLEERLAPGARLGPYAIAAPIGSGGMGDVYRARDERLKRDVAIKVLPASVKENPDRLRRFEQEAQAASALNHPNILAIYDIGSQDGTPYIVSELLEGETLRERLSGGALPVPVAADYASQMARALAAAHARGIVHRDLKPENVFVGRDGQVKVLDFGLAKLTDDESRVGIGSGASGLSLPGVLIGTPAYMSPEQVRSERLDSRSDVFSFGAVLHEMLSGRPAFQRATPAETISAVLKEQPPELEASPADASSVLGEIARRCLEKDPKRRFPAGRDIVAALSGFQSPFVSSGEIPAAPSGRTRRRSRAAAAVAVLLVLVAAGALLARRAQRGAEPQRIAVLPFENQGATEDGYLADGLSDEVRAKLTALPGVEVIARGSSAPYKGTRKTPNEIARELGVRYLLTGTVRWNKNGDSSRVHVVPELVEVRETGTPTDRWQQAFDAAPADVFQVQSEIAARVARALHVAVEGSGEKRLAGRPTGDLAAYDAFLRGEELWNGASTDGTSLRKALAFYEQAAEWDPGFVRAWSRIAQVNARLYLFTVPTPELAERARRAAMKASAAGPGEPEAYLALGGYALDVAGDAGRALEQLSIGRRLAPGDPDLLRETALAEKTLGRWDAAVEHFRHAVALDPRSASSLEQLAAALICLRRYREAQETIDRGLELAPGKLDLIEDKAATHLMEGDLAGARAVLEAAKRNVEPPALIAFLAYAGDFVWVLDDRDRRSLLGMPPGAFDGDRGVWALCLTQAYALEGDAENTRAHAELARRAFEEQVRAAPDDAQRRVCLGLALAYLGRKEEAIREGERGVALDPVPKDAESGPYYQHQLVRIYTLVGEPEKALDRLEPLLRMPSWVSPGLLAIDPNFDRLRQNPRLRKLIAAS